MNQFLEDAYNFNISEENKTAENLNKDLDIDIIQEKIPEYLKQYNNSLADFLEIKILVMTQLKNKLKLQLIIILKMLVQMN